MTLFYFSERQDQHLWLPSQEREDRGVRASRYHVQGTHHHRNSSQSLYHARGYLTDPGYVRWGKLKVSCSALYLQKSK